MVALQMGKLGRHGMLFLAAAVSDFYVPRDKLREHKIDSSRETKGGGAGLTLHLDEVCTLSGQGVMAGGGERGAATRGKMTRIARTNPALPSLSGLCSFASSARRCPAVHAVSILGGGAFVQVPKCLGMIRAEWAPDCFRVSFKLETDLERLLPKARVALKK